MTVQQQIKQTLEQSGIPVKEIKCYGSQIMITAWSHGAASKWASLLSKFATVKSTVKTTDLCKENSNSNLLPSTVEVYRVWATI